MFMHEENRDDLRIIFKELCITKENLKIEELALEALEKFAEYKNICFDINSAINLLRLCEVLLKYTTIGGDIFISMFISMSNL